MHFKKIVHSKLSSFKSHQGLNSLALKNLETYSISWLRQIIDVLSETMCHLPVRSLSSSRTGVCRDYSDFIGDVVTRKILYTAIVATFARYIILWNVEILDRR